MTNSSCPTPRTSVAPMRGLSQRFRIGGLAPLHGMCTKSLISFIAIIALPFASLAAPEIGQTAPDFTTQTVEGETITLSALQGQPVVLEWHNHECPFVVKHYQQGHMQALQKAYVDKGIKWLRVISSAPGKQGHLSDDDAKTLIAEAGVSANYTIRDESGEIGKLYDAKTTPHMFVIDAEGALAYMGAIDSIRSVNSDDIAKATPYVSNALDALIAGEAITVSSTAPYGCSVKY